MLVPRLKISITQYTLFLPPSYTLISTRTPQEFAQLGINQSHCLYSRNKDHHVAFVVHTYIQRAYVHIHIQLTIQKELDNKVEDDEVESKREKERESEKESE